MPEFILDGTEAPDFRALDDFTQGYIQALFFTEESPGVSTEEWEAGCEQGNLGSLPGDVGFLDLAPEALQAIIADCKAFQEVNAALLAEAYDRPGYDEERAGMDFWYTRNGHGVGYWDRKELEAGDLGDRLSERCGWRNKTKPYFGEVYACFGDDRKVHL